jgi:hypothetical protein
VARTRTGAQLIDDAYKRSDNEAATDRHPRTDVLRYVNQGVTELYDLLVAARGASYFRADPAQTITTEADETSYDLEDDFYRLVSVRVARDSFNGYPLIPFDAQEEPELRAGGSSAGFPTHYEIRPGKIAILPEHTAGLSVVVEYIPHATDLEDEEDSTFDGINGWEEYVSLYAALKMAQKDEDDGIIRDIKDDLATLRQRIASLAPKRDAFRARRVRDVRGPQAFGRGRL